MKKHFLFALTAVAVLAGIWACEPTEKDPEPKVEVGAQVSAMIAGRDHYAYYSVTTEGIGVGFHPVSVSGLPQGVSVTAPGLITIAADGTGFLSLSGNVNTTAAVTDGLVMTLLGAKSSEFSLTIAGATLAVATPGTGFIVAAQPAASGNRITFALTPQYVNGGDPLELTSDNVTFTPSLPEGITLVGGQLNHATDPDQMVIGGSETAVAGDPAWTGTVTIGDATSNEFSFSVAGASSLAINLISAGTSLCEGKLGTSGPEWSMDAVSINGGTELNISGGAGGRITYEPALPAGLSPSGRINNSAYPLRMGGTPAHGSAGTWTGKMVVDGNIRTNDFTFTILPGTKVGVQQGTAANGTGGTLTFDITAAGAIVDGSYTVSASPSLSGSGITMVSPIVIAGGVGTLTFNVASTAAAKRVTNQTISFNSCRSDVFTWEITPPAR